MPLFRLQSWQHAWCAYGSLQLSSVGTHYNAPLLSENYHSYSLPNLFHLGAHAFVLAPQADWSHDKAVCRHFHSINVLVLWMLRIWHRQPSDPT